MVGRPAGSVAFGFARRATPSLAAATGVHRHPAGCLCCSSPSLAVRAQSTIASGLHGAGCPCCGPPSGAHEWKKQGAVAKQASARPVSYSAHNGGKEIVCDALVALAVNQLEKRKVRVAPPGPGEVRMKVVANAICHTDLYTLEGSDPEGIFPSILGHEAGCIVESVGAGVTSVAPGDHVIPCYTPQCKKPDCIFCQSNKTNLCPEIRATQGAVRADHTRSSGPSYYPPQRIPRSLHTRSPPSHPTAGVRAGRDARRHRPLRGRRERDAIPPLHGLLHLL